MDNSLFTSTAAKSDSPLVWARIWEPWCVLQVFAEVSKCAGLLEFLGCLLYYVSLVLGRTANLNDHVQVIVPVSCVVIF